MPESEKPDRIDRLVQAYEQMLERVHDALEPADEAKPRLRHLLDQAREKAVELEELSREEADKVATYLERDMTDAATFIAETGQELKDWWRFDLDLVEGKLSELFANVADQTSVQLQRFAEQARRQSSFYQAGEVAGPGTLICTSCGAALQFHKTGRITPCPACRATEFRRETRGESPPA